MVSFCTPAELSYSLLTSVGLKRIYSMTLSKFFDVLIESYHGAKICEMLRLFILNGFIKIKKIDKINYRLYRENGLLT